MSDTFGMSLASYLSSTIQGRLKSRFQRVAVKTYLGISHVKTFNVIHSPLYKHIFWVLEYKVTMRLILLFMLVSVNSLSVLRKRRFERNRKIINEAVTELKFLDCQFIAQVLQNKLENHIWQKCGLFSDCTSLVKRQIRKARKLCSMK